MRVSAVTLSATKCHFRDLPRVHRKWRISSVGDSGDAKSPSGKAVKPRKPTRSKGSREGALGTSGAGPRGPAARGSGGGRRHGGAAGARRDVVEVLADPLAQPDPRRGPALVAVGGQGERAHQAAQVALDLRARAGSRGLRLARRLAGAERRGGPLDAEEDLRELGRGQVPVRVVEE